MRVSSGLLDLGVACLGLGEASWVHNHFALSDMGWRGVVGGEFISSLRGLNWCSVVSEMPSASGAFKPQAFSILNTRS